MSRARFFLFITLGALSLLWSASALWSNVLWLAQRDLITVIRSGTGTPDRTALTNAIAHNTRTLRLMPCATSLHEDLLLMLAAQADTAMASDAIDAADAALETTQTALASVVACTPMNGKAWLDFAMLTVHREGFTPRSLEAYKMSARVAPGESWLAEKRLLFALQFRLLLDEPARDVARQDIAVLENAHPNRILAVMKTVDLQTPPELYALFNRPAT